MPQAVPQVPFGAEAQGLEGLRLLHPQVAHLLRRVGPQGVRRRAGQHLPHGEEADAGHEQQDRGQHGPAEARHVQLPRRQVDVGGHGAAGAQDVPAQQVSHPDAQRDAHQPDHQRVGRIVQDDPPVPEAQGLQGADLGFLAGGDPVHRGHHGQHRDGQEQHRQDGAHGLPLFDFTPGLGPGHVLVPPQNQGRLPQGPLRRGHEIRLRQIRDHVDLGIELEKDRLLQHRRGDVGKPVGVVVRHHLGFIREADHIFPRLDEPLHRSPHLHDLIGQPQAVPHMDAVLLRVLVGQPDAVQAFRVVGLPVHQIDAGDPDVLADGQRQHVRVPLHRGVHRQEAGSFLHAVHGQDFFQILGGKSLLRVDPVVREARSLQQLPRVPLQAVPFHVEAHEHAHAQRDHNDHGNKLGLVFQQRPQPFFPQHLTSPPLPPSWDAPDPRRRRSFRSSPGPPCPPFWRSAGCGSRR